MSHRRAIAGQQSAAAPAPDYTIVGAGYSAVNGGVTLTLDGWYESADGRTALSRVVGFGWYITYDADNNGSFELLLYSAADGATPPASGWTSADAGYDPAPTIT